MKNNTIKIYYIILVLVITIKVVTTIFTNGLAVHHGKKVAQLEIQRNNLQIQQLKLNRELSSKSSLATVTNTFDTSEFTAISNPIIIKNSTTVASN